MNKDMIELYKKMHRELDKAIFVAQGLDPSDDCGCHMEPALVINEFSIGLTKLLKETPCNVCGDSVGKELC